MKISNYFHFLHGKTKVFFALFILQLILLEAHALDVSIDDSGDLPLLPNSMDVMYDYDPVSGKNYISFDVGEPIVCTSINDTNQSLALEAFDGNSFNLTESMVGMNGISSFIYDVSTRHISIKTDSSIQCATEINVLGVNTSDNVFTDGFEVFNSNANANYLLLELTKENGDDFSQGQTFGPGTLVYKYKVTNTNPDMMGDDLSVDLVEYSQNLNNSAVGVPSHFDGDSVSCDDSFATDCGTIISPTGSIRLNGALIGPSEFITITVTRTVVRPNLGPNETVKILAAAFNTNSTENIFGNNVVKHDFITTDDNTAPLITEVTAVVTPANDDTPDYVFNSNEDGTINFTNCNGSSITSGTSISAGNNTITFEVLPEGVYSGCKFTVSDNSSNESLELIIPDFTLDLTAPIDPPTFTPPFSAGPTLTSLSNNSTIMGVCGNGALGGLIGYRSSTGSDLINEPIVSTLMGLNFTSQLTWNSGGAKQFFAACIDDVGNPGPEVAINVFVDLLDPLIVTFGRAGSQNPTTFDNSAQFEVEFSEIIAPLSFEESDIILNGTATGSITSFSTNDNITWSFTVTGMTHDDTIQPSIATGATTDIAGNFNEAGSSTNSVHYLAALVEFSSDLSLPENSGVVPKLLVKGTLNSDVDVNINIENTSTATSPNDYTFATTTIPMGTYNSVTEFDINLSIEDDAVVELDQVIDFKIISTTGDLTIGDANEDLTINNTNSYTIVNNDSITLSINNPAPVDEGNSGPTSLGFIVTATGQVETDVTIPLTLMDVNTDPSDYNFNGMPLVISAANTNMSNSFHAITVFIIGDSSVELDEMFTINLGAPSLSGVTISTGVGTGTILNDD